MSDAIDPRHLPAPTERSGAKRWSHHKLLRKGIIEDEDDPTTYRQGVKPGEFHSVLWAVVFSDTSALLTYTLKVWKLVGIYKDDNTTIVEGWVLETAYTGLTGNAVKLQAVDGCRLYATLDDIVLQEGGSLGADGAAIVYIGTNRQV